MGYLYANSSNGFPLIAGEALAMGDVVAISSSDGKVYKANAKTGDNQQVPAVGITEVAVALGAYVEVKYKGKFTGASSLTPGAAVYLAETDGAVTDDAPSDAGDVVQYVGFALSATEFIFDAKVSYSTVAGS